MEREKNEFYDLPTEVNDDTLVELLHAYSQGADLEDRDNLDPSEQKLLQRSKLALDSLFQQYGGLVPYWLKNDFHIRENNTDYEDLLQEGYIILLKSIRKSDIAHINSEHPQASFISYCKQNVYYGIKRNLGVSTGTIGLPVHVRESLRLLKIYGEQTIDPKLLSAASRSTRILPLESGLSFSSNREFTTSEGLPGLKSDPIDRIASEIDEEGWPLASTFGLKEIISNALWMLPERDAHVLRLRYLGGMTLEKVGQKIGVQRERARQIEARALSTLRKAAAQNIFEGYIAKRTYYIPPDKSDQKESPKEESILEAIDDRTNALLFQYSRFHTCAGLARRLTDSGFILAKQLLDSGVNNDDIVDFIYQSIENPANKLEYTRLFELETKIGQIEEQRQQERVLTLPNLSEKAKYLEQQIPLEKRLIKGMIYGSKSFEEQLQKVKGMQIELERVSEEIQSIESLESHFDIVSWLRKAIKNHELPSRLTQAVLSATLAKLSSLDKEHKESTNKRQ